MRATRFALLGLCWAIGCIAVALAETEIAQVKLVKVDLQQRTLTLQRTGQAEFVADLHKNPRLWWEKKPLALEKLAEHTGKRVMVRMSVDTGRKPIVRELADPDTWKWLDTVRRGVVKGVLKALDEETLTLEFPDKSEFTYRHNARTQWEKGGQPASPEDFKQGEVVFIAPRLLSNLDTLAQAVSDREQDTQQARERTLPTVQGVVQTHDLLNRRISIRTRAGDTREFVYDQNTEFVSEGKPIKPQQVKVGATITVHRRRSTDGSEYARRITLHPPQKS
ncbi:MAG: DUF5666 domain-containing protein [Armatimonadetes bacterium]|nr:DUF5666 domain-containing protein [Armatimonadota bacterium]GIV12896.1 MAG: hypothetical protein KatS3mg021_1178 [Fimbriimonadales bacterium]CUU37610.1 hypothetical protein DCOP10_120129 [Armatimonadetes bacterium DC]